MVDTNSEYKKCNEILKKLSVDKSSPVPVYYQIKEQIKALIDEKQIMTHVKIPSERELSSLYCVSRMTVRQALTELVKEGYLYRKKGRGTFVAPPKITHTMEPISFSEDMHRRGMEPGGRTLLKKRITDAKKSIRDALGLKEGEPLLLIERLRFADKVPLVLERSYFSYNRFKKLEQKDLDTDSLYGILEREFNIIPVRSREYIEAGVTDKYLSEILKIGRGMPILVVTAVSFEENGQPVEYVESYYRGDRYRFYVEREKE